MIEMDGKSEDILQDNIEALGKLFPEVLCDGKIDFDKLRYVLGDTVDDESDRYNFTWHGKNQARRLSQTPSMGTLRPGKEQSKDWDTTKNLYIEGDNLEVLKLLQKSYHGKVKMIYIDPPYNTGSDFVYHDDFRDNLANYQRLTGQADDAGKVYTTNSETSGRYHTDWLNMIFPRLRLARNLLSEDGVIFISIDDNEQANLTQVCDDVFGSENRIGPIIQNKQNAKNDTVNIQKNHEFILVYRKNKLMNGKTVLPTLERQDIKYKDVLFEDGRYFYLNDTITTRGEGGTLNARPKLGYTVYYHPETKDLKPVIDYDIKLARTSNDEDAVYQTDQSLVSKGYVPIRAPRVRGKLGCWTWEKPNFENNKDRIYITGKPGAYAVHSRTFVDEADVINVDGKSQYKQVKFANSKSILDYSTNDGSTVLASVLDDKAGVFSNPKNLDMIQYFVELVNDKSCIILDFFSGSATTAHAVMKLNAADGGNRRFIMAQLPEQCAEGTEAKLAGYNNICEIGEERIRRAGQSIKDSCTEGGDTLDVGFRVFKLDTSNLKKWQPDDSKPIKQLLLDAENNVLPDRSEEDVLYEIILKLGYDLSCSIEEHTIAGTKVFVTAAGALFICLADHITLSVAEGMAKLHQELAPEVWKVVCRDTGFRDDAAKVNVREILKSEGLDEDAFVTL